jgi:Putative peptidoglycan binding domain
MDLRIKLSVGAFGVVALLAAGLSYWLVSENSQPAASGGAPPLSETIGRLPTTSAPAAAPATSQPSQAAAPPPKTIVSAPAPAISQPSQAAAASAPTTAPTPATSPPPSSRAVAPTLPRTTPTPAEAHMSEADRRQAQQALHRLGFYQGHVDGIFGPLTRAAIRRFQQDIGAESTGFLTPDEATRLLGKQGRSR